MMNSIAFHDLVAITGVLVGCALIVASVAYLVAIGSE